MADVTKAIEQIKRDLEETRILRGHLGMDPSRAEARALVRIADIVERMLEAGQIGEQR